jgi:ferredoxin-nitrate reductase
MMQTRDAIADIWGQRTPYEGDWPVRVDERTTAEPEKWVQSACVLCSNGCALDIGVKDGKIVGVRGRAVDRVNHGRLGPKGLYGWEANNSSDRLRTPLVRRDGELREATWDEAMDLVARKSKEVMESSTANAIGFYTTGQMFIEEYYTLGVIGKAGIGTPHMDGNTRLCTATAESALRESFGTDGQPGSYTDIDVTDALFAVGHNIASQQTVLWARMLDRLDGANPPKLVVVDPRRTETAKRADVHLALKVGTNVALLNGLLHLILKAGHVNRCFIDEHTKGFEKLEKTVEPWTPGLSSQITGVPENLIREAAEILGTAPRLVSTVLQGVYQSNQATAAALQVNNIHLVRGLIGKPGSTVFQMNGQPTAQNTRECGCNGTLPAMRNWHNPAHIEELARIWNVDKSIIPDWTPPTHAMEIFRFAETGSIKFLWIVCTNPAVSLPESARIRRILAQDNVFVVVQDPYMTETAELADVVLPAAMWGERTGCFTNVDRTVHISHKAVDPPAGARSDFDIFLDYAKRMDFRDKDGAPLIKWCTPEEAFDAWRECSRGRPCDYSGLSYEKLSEGSGIQWPCNDEYPDGRERLYENGVFNTDAQYCETFGYDLVTGAETKPEVYKADDPKGRALIKPADYQPPHEVPDDGFPYMITTGRVVYQFHTRTKTARTPELNAAAPDAFVQMAQEDAEREGFAEGDLVEVATRRGVLQAPLRIGDILPGHVFVPFHYGYWDDPERPRAANELTLTEWDPVSKQPHFKYAAAKVRKANGIAPEKALESVRKVAADARKVVKGLPGKLVGKASRGHIADYLGLIDVCEQGLAVALEEVGNRHQAEADVAVTCKLLASWCRAHSQKLRPHIERYGERSNDEPRELAAGLFKGTRSGGYGLIRDLHDIWLLANEAHIAWFVLHLAARAAHDTELVAAIDEMDPETDRIMNWTQTRIDQAASQALVVPL